MGRLIKASASAARRALAERESERKVEREAMESAERLALLARHKLEQDKSGVKNKSWGDSKDVQGRSSSTNPFSSSSSIIRGLNKF